VLAVGLALAASLSFGAGDFLGGLASRRLRVLAVLLLSQIVGLAGIGILVAARGAAWPGFDFVPAAAVAGAFATVGLVSLYRGLAVGLMSVVAPISATAAAVPVVASLAVGEAPSPLQGAGMAFALAGVALVSRPGRLAEAGARLAAGAGLGLLAASAFGIFFVAFDSAAEEDPYWATFVLRVTSLSLLIAAALVVRPPLGAAARLGLPLAAIGILDVAGNALFAVASTKGLVGIVSVLTSLYPVATVALARAFLGERLGPAQATGVGLAFAGVGLIAVG
jgi:drug/metabolite transporter (DMT)-like permease